MPPRLVLCVEFGAHLYQSRRLDHGILEAAIAKLLAFDLIADSEVALILFGQQHSTRGPFKRLDGKLDPTLYSPPIDPFDEPAKLFSEQELQQMDIQAASSAKIIKGSCSFAKLMGEVGAALAQRNQFDDLGADVVVVTSGLFIEDEAKIEDIVKLSSFKPEIIQINLIIYPSTMLFDTKSRDGFIVLDALESEAIIKHRVNKLLLIQRLTNAKIHLVKEHLDANGDVKMSTLLQFHQIFEQITKGHSWDQTHSMITIAQQLVEPQNPSNLIHHQQQLNGSKLSFQFELDSSVQNELLVGFIDPKHHSQSKIGKRFAIKNLQLRSPNGQLVFTDSHPWTYGPLTNHPHNNNNNNDLQLSANLRAGEESPEAVAVNDEPIGFSDVLRGSASGSASSNTESALFPYRSQLSLAGFHLKPAHLAQLNASHQLAGVWTLTATADEPIQTSGIAMARANTNGDTVTANCWIQTYYQQQADSSSAHSNQLLDSELLSDSSGKSNANSAEGQLKTVKVFMQTKAGAHLGPVQDITARMEVQDEMGNIVQNVNMLDDGIGSPDMTKGDGIYSQYVQRAYRPGFYKVNVELSSDQHHHYQSSSRAVNKLGANVVSNGQQIATTSGQDNACCGSFIPKSNQPDTRHLNRLLYCGTFHVEANNKLAQQRPPRVNNLTVINVDQDNRRVTIRWFEPSIDISVRANSASKFANLNGEVTSLEEQAQQTESLAEPQALKSSSSRLTRASDRLSARQVSSHQSARSLAGEQDGDVETSSYGREAADLAFERQSSNQAQQMRQNSIRGLIFGGKNSPLSETSPLSGRYEIKLFSDREMMKRAFDAKHEIGFKFNEWNVEGTFPNASAYGGMKEVTLRIPHGREGIYFIALKVYNNLGIGSQLSNIVQFYIRNNLTNDEAEAIYGQATTLDPDGNGYDKNGELIQRGYLLLRGRPLDGLSALLIFSVLMLVCLISCIVLIGCLATTARHSLGKRKVKSEDKKAVTGSMNMGGAGSGSSMVSSGCGSSQQSEVASSIAGSQEVDGHDVEISKLALGEDLNYNNLHQQHSQQQHQSALIQSQMISASQQQQQQQYSMQQPQYNNPTNQYGKQQQHQIWPQHTLINGYAYATVNSAGGGQKPGDHMQQLDQFGNLNQNGLGEPVGQVHSWPADVLLSHYDKVKQARERNEAPPIMRIETIEHQGQFSEGLPAAPDEAAIQQQAAEQSYLVRQQRNSAANYLNQQLQQQLTSVLKTKHQWTQKISNTDSQQQYNMNTDKSSPALDGVTELNDVESEMGAGYHHSDMSIPPPQYVYCDEAGLGPPPVSSSGHQQTMMGVEPTIYSQVTNLQQVPSTMADSSMSGYYANQWSMANQQQASNGIYSIGQSQYQQPSTNQTSNSNDYSTTNSQLDSTGNNNKTNSAISEV